MLQTDNDKNHIDRAPFKCLHHSEIQILLPSLKAHLSKLYIQLNEIFITCTWLSAVRIPIQVISQSADVATKQ